MFAKVKIMSLRFLSHKVVSIFLAVLLASCAQYAPAPIETSEGHISSKSIDKTSVNTEIRQNIPSVVEDIPVLPLPTSSEPAERYTVVVNEVPAKELLFALARDAKINIDIDPTIEGFVTINAIEQTLPQILERIASQVDLRYEFKSQGLVIQTDEPYLKSYRVNYINLSRETTGSVSVSTQIDTTGSTSTDGSSGGSAGGNNSITEVSSSSVNRFWQTLAINLMGIVGEDLEGISTDDAKIPVTNRVIVSPETGVVNVRATQSQHRQVQRYIDTVLLSVDKQVLIEATVVEVELSDQYQAGIDWSIIQDSAGLSVISSLVGAGATGSAVSLASPNTSSFFRIDYDNNDGTKDIDATISLLREFGNTRVLSSPQLMVLSNHTAVLKVVENFVYFTVEQELEPANATTGAAAVLATTTTPQTVPIGFVMSVTPKINDNESVTLTVRPTITNVVRTINDPNPALSIANPVPVIRVREMESILKIDDRDIAVLGGLMQDTIRNGDNDTPFLSDVPVVGEAFKSRSRESFKTELVIFIRPVVIRDASIDADLQRYRDFLDYQRDIPKPATGTGVAE